ncbi:bifunctional diaminohydroxyphosphoribosylaminopyrimidine deaminase/5-amino-6-(5-phosphoribosylamino)uracil reductase RibD [Saccharobesus litoralis]|uniref:Riboflavin biosynthesis protein RibD n=1 Tax=Saccharobesus litoralis TaxID=2172099 RepID=A0A2S0VL89_9ALTE|nr:bifunctional diaminohydroxyphosphoribosylaminopyrimidine deaminase/5-amino-6-(5-phosphoribosylamino)uracil reductase RibD [Saccharobesus litoralis]AWB64973.1 bifunctional diaminohydroxyphosphoribosylaminopyrimidine deaminase/5-amino-6-(5-phosphoribosylamino)uracil reductase RibD [Saccharobesus litoralis]
MLTKDDFYWMAKAIQLAKKGLYTTSPNPRVGCVLVKSGQVIGEGFHLKAGELHAERNAIADANNKGHITKGATAYVTLEPCSHHGRTPPCADGLIEAGIQRVVVGMVDPNPQVDSKGVAKLQAAGIEIDTLCLAQDCEQLNLGFTKRMRTGLPYVRLKLAASIDGRTAMADGESKWITGPQARADVQHYRAQSCAIISGSGTVEVDQPALNVRKSELTSYPTDDVRQPLRVIIDSKKKVSASNRFFSHNSPTLFVGISAERPELPDNVTYRQVASKRVRGEDKVDLTDVLAYLATQGINDVWVEAGAHMAGAFIEADLVDELIIYQAPLLMGEQTFGLVNLPETDSLALAHRWSYQSVTQIGEDLKLILHKKG